MTRPTTAVLFVSQDGGVRWQVAEKISAKVGLFNFTAHGEGNYTFAVRILPATDSNQVVWPQDPELFVTVDYTKPMITANLIPTPSDRYQIEWWATDPGLVNSSRQVHCFVAGEGKWYPVRYQDVNVSEDTGVFRGLSVIELPVGTSQVRVSIRDSAGNVGAEEVRLLRQAGRPAARGSDVYQASHVKDDSGIRFAFREDDPRIKLTSAVGRQLPRNPDEQIPRPVPMIEENASQALPTRPILQPATAYPVSGTEQQKSEILPPLGNPRLSIEPTPMVRNTSDEEVLLRAARNSIALKEYGTALERYKRVLELNPNNQIARREYASLIFRMGGRGAIEQYDRVLANSTYNPDVIKEFADVLIAGGLHKRAIDLLHNLVRETPQDIDAIGKLILAELDFGNYTSARRRFDQTFSGFDRIEQWNQPLLAELHFALGHPSKALPLAESTYRRDPQDIESAILLVRVLTQLRRHDDALEIVTRASIDISHDTQRWLDLADEMSFAGNTETSEFIYSVLLDGNPQLVAAAVGRSQMLLRQGLINPASQALKSLDVSRQNPEVRAAWAEIHLLAGEYVEALSLTDSILHTDSSPRIRKLMADIHLAITALGLAESEYLQAGADGADIELALSRLYMKSGQLETAVALARQVIELDHFNKAGWEQYVAAEIRAGGQAAALALVRESLAAEDSPSPFSQLLHSLVGLLYVSQHQPVIARQEFELGYVDTGKNPSYAPIAYHYYHSLVAAGRFQQAESHLTNALRQPLVGVAMARLANHDREFEIAKQIVFQVSERYPDNILVLQVYAEILANQNSHECEAVCHQILEQSPTNVQAKLTLAGYYWSSRCFEAADKLFLEILRDIPDHREAGLNRARMMLQWQGKKAAINAYETALSVVPRSVNSALLGDLSVLQSQKQFHSLMTAEAVSLKLEQQATALSDWRPVNAACVLETLHEIEPIDEHVTFQMAQQYRRLGQTRNAINAYEEFLAIDPNNFRIQRALERSYLKLQPRLIGTTDFFHQGGRQGLSEMSRFRFGAKALFPLCDENEYFAIGYSHQIYMPNGPDPLLGNILEVESRRELADGLFFFADMDVEMYHSRFSTRPTFESGIDYRVLDGLDLGFDVFLHNVAENSESIRQNLFRYGLRPRISWKITPYWSFDGEYQLQNYSDDNIVHSFAINNDVELSPPPRQLLFSAAYHFNSFEEQTVRNPLLSDLTGTVHPYFAPADFSYVTLDFEWRHWLSDFQPGEHQCYYGIRYGVEWDSFNVFYNSFGATFYWDLNAIVTLSVGSDFLRSGAYDSASVMTFLDIILP
ncbi:MAG: tetratricopeptide repeat protein [Pirellulaceae bacterium]